MEDNNNKKVILITGSNRGLGLGIVKHYYVNEPKTILIMTSRNKIQGEQIFREIISLLPENYKSLYFHTLDIVDKESRLEFINFLRENGLKLNVLINNAAINNNDYQGQLEEFDKILNTNYFSTVKFTDELINNEMLSLNSKIINISSRYGTINYLSKELKDEFLTEITLSKIEVLIEKMRISAGLKKLKEDGWQFKSEYGDYPAYALSKLCLNLFTKILSQKEYIVNNGIQVYSITPGWVKTDMGGENAKLTIEEGVNNIKFLIELPHKINENQGKFFKFTQAADYWEI